jgi:hypothetical protein
MRKQKPLKKIKGDELLDLLVNNGILPEVNRTFFNPLGLNLQLEKDLTLSIEKAEEEHGIIQDTINKLALRVFMKFAQEKHRARQQMAGFVIQTQDMIRKDKLETPVTSPATLKLETLLKEVDQFAYNIKKRIMEKSKTYDQELFDLDEAALSYDMFEDLQHDNFIDGTARAIFLNGIDRINVRMKEIRKIEKDQKKVYKEKK